MENVFPQPFLGGTVYMLVANLGMAFIAVFPCGCRGALAGRICGSSSFLHYVGCLSATCCDFLHAQPQQKAQGPIPQSNGPW